MRVGLPDRYVTHGKPALLHEEIGFTPERIAERVAAAISDRGHTARRAGSATIEAQRRGKPRARTGQRATAPARRL